MNRSSLKLQAILQPAPAVQTARVSRAVSATPMVARISYEPDEELNATADADAVISNRTLTTNTKMSGRKEKYPWRLRGDRSVSGQAVYFKEFPTKDPKTGKMRMTKAYAVEENGRPVKTTLFFINTGMYPNVREKRPGRLRATVGNRAYHLGGAPKAEYLKARKMFLAAETPKERRADRRTQERLVYTAAEYIPKVNDFPGLDEAVGRKRWSSKAMDYVAPKARTISEYQRAVMKWARTGKVGAKPQRVGPEPAYLIKKRQRELARAARIVDAQPSRKRGRDDDGEVYDPEIFRGNLPGLKRQF